MSELRPIGSSDGLVVVHLRGASAVETPDAVTVNGVTGGEINNGILLLVGKDGKHRAIFADGAWSHYRVIYPG